jgi:hypothetical protein
MRASYSTRLSRALIFLTSCRIQNASSPSMRSPTSPERNPRALYPLASFLYRASLMMAMNRIANSAGSSGTGREQPRSRRMSRNGAIMLTGSANSAAHGAPLAVRLLPSQAQRILIYGGAIKYSRILHQISHLRISNRRQTAPLSRAPRAQKRESNESQSAR